MKIVGKEIFIYCIVLVKIIPHYGQTGSDLKNLLTELFTNRDYMKNVRPNAYLGDPMIVHFDFFLSGVTEINEIKQTLTTTGSLQIIWDDENLMWDPASYDGLVDIYVSQSDIWKPHLTLRNGIKKLDQLGGSFLNVQIKNTGMVIWKPVEVFDSKCKIDVKYFPFDIQTCELIFVAWASSIKWIIVIKGDTGIVLDDLEENGEWRVVSTSGFEDEVDGQATVIVQLILARSSSYYVMNIIVPIVLLAILNVFTFVLPADSGEKMGYAITVFLAFAVFLTIVSSELPRTSGSVLGTYLMFQIGMGTFVVCFTAIELRLHHRQEPVPPRIVQMLHLLKRSRKVSDSNQTEDGEQYINVGWSDVISKIDFILFWTLLFVFIIVTSAYLVICLQQIHILNNNKPNIWCFQNK